MDSDSMETSKESERELPTKDPEITPQRAFESVAKPTDFDSWTALIAGIEKTSPVEAEEIFLAYDSFLAEYPLCYGYWRKYAGHKARLCSVDKVVEVYERAVQSATYCVDLWVDYCSFSMLLFEDPADVRRLFERGISFVRKDYLCYILWDKYIEFEYSQKQWSFLAHIYIRALKFPTKKLESYYNSLKKLAFILEEEIKVQVECSAKVQSEETLDFEVRSTTAYDDEEISLVIRDLFDPAYGLRRTHLLQKYLSIGEMLYHKASQINAKVHCFENRIRRPYFHFKPLDTSQLDNWHQYLDFIEMQGDFDWTVKLYERCLIPCANYPEFWMRYVEFMESMGGREIANFALVRATQVFLKRIPAIHLFCARFKEKQGDVFGSRSAFWQFDSDLSPNFIENVRREAHMEIRLGNPAAAFSIYENAIEMARYRKNNDSLLVLYVHLARFKYVVTGHIDAARDTLIEGTQSFPRSKILIEGLLNFEMMHRGPKQINIVDSIVNHAISPAPCLLHDLSDKDREDISSLYLEFVDQCGTIDDIMKAWKRHRKLFPHLIRLDSFNRSIEKQDMVMALPHHASGDDISQASFKPLELDENSSLPEKPDIQSDHATAVEHPFGSTNKQNEKLQSLTSANVIEQPGQDITKLTSEANNLVVEVFNDHEVQDVAQEFPEGTNRIQSKADSEPSNDLGPPMEILSLNSRDVIQNSTPTTSHCEIPQARPGPNESRQRNGENTNSLASLICLKSDSLAEVHTKSDYAPSHKPNTPSSVQMQPTLEPLVPTSSPSRPISGGNVYEVNYDGQPLRDSHTEIQEYPQTQQPQLQRLPQQQYQSHPMHAQTPRTQSFHSQLQPSQNQPMQTGNQTPNPHQVAAAQVQQLKLPLWPSQNMQQQYFASAALPQPQLSSQSISYPQAQGYQYPQQGSMQYGHVQGNQLISPHMWHYYYPPQPQQQQNQPPPQPQQQQNQPPPQQQQYYHQQITPLQMQTWTNNYYQQQAPVQYYGSSQYRPENSQQAIVSQGQGAIQQNIEPATPSVCQFPQQLPPSNQ